MKTAKSHNADQTGESELLPALASEPQLPVTRNLTSLDILGAAVKGGVTAENVAVVKEIIAMRREEVREEAKAAFARSFFQLRKNMPTFYADKEAKNDNGKVVFVYCSEEELSRMLEPVLFQHGFTTLFGQRQEGDKVVAILTLMHEAGHQETREYSVRGGSTNRMKDATSADAGSTTTAWRHLVIKMFGLKSRISADHDPRNEGDNELVTSEQAFELERRVNETESNVGAFLKFAGAKSFAEIRAGKYAELDAMLSKKEGRGR